MTKPIYLIVACDEQDAIGYQGELPWDIPEDWQFFLESTCGGVLLMGRVSYESMKRSEAFESQDRAYIIISRSLAKQEEPNVHVVRSVEDALSLSMELPGRIWCCGGVDIYRTILPKADYLVMTRIKASFDADRYFPDDWRLHFPHRLQTIERSDKAYQYSFNLFSTENPRPGCYQFSELSLFSDTHE